MSEEIRKVSSTGGEKGSKPERFSLLPPEALEKIARHYGVGAAKYDDHNWRKGYDWSLSYDSLLRHANAFWSGEDIDEETGSPHMAAVAFHAMTLLVFMVEHPDFDDRYKRPELGVAPGAVFGANNPPTVAGFYLDGDRDILELREDLLDGEGRWSVARFANRTEFVEDLGDRVWLYESELEAPLTRVEDPRA